LEINFNDCTNVSKLFLSSDKMVGIYNKIKNGLNWLKGKAAKYVAPVVSTLGDFANSEFVQGAAGLLTPALNMAIPGLGTGISKGLQWAGQAGDIAKGLAEGYAEYGDDFSLEDMYKNVTSGKYKSGKKSKKRIPGGIDLSKRPDDLHPRIELKALMPAEDEFRTGSFVEELD
jgi:hypothetical protein